MFSKYADVYANKEAYTLVQISKESFLISKTAI